MVVFNITRQEASYELNRLTVNLFCKFPATFSFLEKSSPKETKIGFLPASYSSDFSVLRIIRNPRPFSPETRHAQNTFVFCAARFGERRTQHG
jgi:hypothetical protein